MSSTPYHWLSEIRQGLETLKQIPLWGDAPSFPFDDFARKLQEALSVDQVSITCKDLKVISLKDYKSEMGESPFVITLHLPPIKGELLWILSFEDAQKLSSFGLSQKGISLTTPMLLEGFYKYVCLEALHILETMPAYEGVHFRMSHSHPSGKEASCLEVEIRINDKSLLGRLVVTEEFLVSWKAHFSKEKNFLLDVPHIQDIHIPLEMQIGSTELSLEEWKKLSVGDFLILDRCSFDPSAHKGNLSILLHNIPLFQGRFKNQSIKIIDYAFYYEEENLMNEEMSNENDFEHDEEFLEEDSSSKTREKVEKILDTKEIKLPVHVEVGKVEISLQKLLQLKPGNLLELHLRPEEGVYLTVHGKRVAKAELVKLGDLLGVKILEIGTQRNFMIAKDFHKFSTVKELPKEESLPIPNQIGPYQIESLFRKGGMSLLYLGLEPETRKTIMIKVLSPEYINREGMVRQFLQEAEIIKITSHPNIVDLYGHGEWEGGLYIAMEFIQGVSLRQFISQHSLSLRRCLEIILQVSYALCHLHTHGIIHRDLKPENILITEDGEIKVIDFGIAQLHEEKEEPQEKSGFIGTPDYMSPEQKENPKKASFASDIYALGIITYELIIGKLSFGMIHLSLLPKELRKIVEKTIAISVDERYPDIVNFISDISQYLKSGAIEKERPGTDQWKELLEELQKAEQTLNTSQVLQWPVDLGIAKSKAPGQIGLFYELLTLKNQTHCILMWKSPIEGAQASIFGAMLRGMIQSISKDLSLDKFLETLNRIVTQDPLHLQFQMCLVALSLGKINSPIAL